MSKYYYSDDSAGFGPFYYGYETIMSPNTGNIYSSISDLEDVEGDDSDYEWCFVVKIKGDEDFVLPLSKLGCDDRYNVHEALGNGIAIFMELHKDKFLRAGLDI